MRLIPSDRRDFAYTVNYFRAGRGGNVRLRLADGTVTTIVVAAGESVYLPVRRVYRTGTTAGDFQTTPAEPACSPNAYTPVPYAPAEPPTAPLLVDDGTAAVPLLADDGTPLLV